jgi:hypothetical protein
MIDRRQSLAIDVSVISPSAAAFAAVFPPGRPRRAPVLSAVERAVRTREARSLGTARLVGAPGETMRLSSVRQQELTPVGRGGETPIVEAGLRVRADVRAANGRTCVSIGGELPQLVGEADATGARIRSRAITLNAVMRDGETWSAVIGGPADGESAPAVVLVRSTSLFDATVTK